jgi:hypothetical protein
MGERRRTRGSYMTICDVKTGCEILSAVLAFLAAGFWFYSSWIARGSFLQTVIAEYDRVVTAQARYNAIAALCAGLAAILQIIVVGFMPVCRAFA